MCEEGLPTGPRDGLGAVGPPLHGSRSSGPAAAARTSRSSRWRCRTLAEQQADLPDWRLDHLHADDRLDRACSSTPPTPSPTSPRATAPTTTPAALLLTVLLEELGQGRSRRSAALATTYAAFLQAAFDPRAEAVPQLPELRPPLAGGGRLGGLPRAGPVGPGRLRRPVAAAATCRPGPPRTSSWPCPPVLGDDLAPGLGVRPAGHPGVPPPAQRRPARPPRSATRLTARLLGTVRADSHARLALVRGDPQLRQRPAAARPDRQRPRRRQRRALEVGLQALGWLVEVQTAPQGHFRAIGCQRVLPQGAGAGPVRPAADRGQRDGLRLPGGLPGHRGPGLAERGPLRLRVVPRPQRPGPGALRPGHRRLLRRPPGGPDQPEPGGRIDPRLPPLPRRDEPAGKLPGGIPPGAVRVPGRPRTGRRPPITEGRKLTTDMDVKRTGIILKPTNSRVVIRPFELTERGPDREDHRAGLVPLRAGGRAPAGRR